jgi:pSer/pThr/pTyr-binding forkhead associated (FHA) protein
VQFRFTHLSGPNQGHIDTLEKTPILIGRDEICHVRLDKHKDLAVSSQHAQIEMPEEGKYKLSNLSRNGTWINGVVVETTAPIPNHSVIQLGRDGPRLRFDVDENVAGISFQRARETAKLKKKDLADRTPAPDTEERPIFKLDDTDDKRSGISVSPTMLAVGGGALLVLGLVVGVLYAILRH